MTKEQRDDALRAHQRIADYSLSSRSAAIEASNIAIRSLFLVNGGAVIVLLGFIGAIESSEASTTFGSSRLSMPVLCFALGVGAAVFTAFLAYLIHLTDEGIYNSYQRVWSHPYVIPTENERRAWWRRTVLFPCAVMTALVSFGLFLSGVLWVQGVISGSGI